jgi:hypothetical protein
MTQLMKRDRFQPGDRPLRARIVLLAGALLLTGLLALGGRAAALTSPDEASPEPSIHLADSEPRLNVGETDLVTLTLRNDGAEEALAWGIQVRVSDGLALVEQDDFPWSAAPCDGDAVEWLDDTSLDPGESASVRVGVMARTIGAYETISYTAWMTDSDGQPEPVQYAHPYWGDPCDRGYAHHPLTVTRQLTDKAARASAIQTAAHEFIVDFKELPDGLPQNQEEAIVLSVAAQESGGHGFNNEMVSFDWGRGIMQITWPNSYVGAGSNGCRGNQDCWDCQNRVDREACHRYYTNTPEGVGRNVRDGLYVLQDKYSPLLAYPPTWEPVDLGLGDPVTGSEMAWMLTLKRYGPNYNASKPFYYVREIGKLLSWELPAHYDDQPTYPVLGDKLTHAYGHLIHGSGSADLRVRDDAGRVTGQVGADVEHGLPNAWYNRWGRRVTLLYPRGAYYYQFAGREQGLYGFDAIAEPEITSAVEVGSLQTAATFAVADVPIAAGAVHEYEVNWADDGRTATRRIDENGDGFFEGDPDPIYVPTAFFTAAPINPYTGEQVIFDAGSSYDPDDNIVSYDWDFGDGSPPITGPLVAHRFSSPGTYYVRLTVRDAHGALDTAYLTINVTLNVTNQFYLPLVAR